MSDFVIGIAIVLILLTYLIFKGISEIKINSVTILKIECFR